MRDLTTREWAERRRHRAGCDVYLGPPHVPQCTCGYSDAPYVARHAFGTRDDGEGDAVPELLGPLQEAREAVRMVRETRGPVRLGDIGRLLLRVQAERGMTGRELARRLGTSESAVSRDRARAWRGLTVARACRVAAALGVEIVVTPAIPEEGGRDAEA